jgi:hypothetical protein
MYCTDTEFLKLLGWFPKVLKLNAVCVFDVNALNESITSRGSSVSIVSDYGLDDQGSIPDRSRGFFL